MIERRGRFCLTDEALHPIRIRRDAGRQDLQRHFPIELGVLGQVHGAHPAGTEQGGDPVVFERAVNHKGARGLTTVWDLTVADQQSAPLNGSSPLRPSLLYAHGSS